MSPKWLLGVLLLAGLAVSGCQSGPRKASGGFTVEEKDGRIRIEHAGQLVSEYHFRDVSRPFLYPILGPDDVHLTRRWPQEEFPGEEKDHPHHHALWWAHGEANGQDFWSESAKAGKTVHQYFTRRSGGREAVVAARNRWVAKSGEVVAEDERKMTFHAPGKDLRILDFEITVFAGEKGLELGDTKEGTMAIRVAESMRLVKPDKSRGAGRILNSDGDADGATWGKRAAWCDYVGPVGDGTYGVAMFDHPSNLRFPTWWHVRDYGLFAANHFGLHDFEKKPVGAGNHHLAPGATVTFRYRFVLHRGPLEPARLNALHEAYSQGKLLP